jgi:protein-S-isoprenylcysteine O-methyltransferase Ste14
VCGFAAWGTIYFLRSVTEEQFLSRDPEYVAYCQRVKYRFIPGIY